jgi:hypothetical protein
MSHHFEIECWIDGVHFDNLTLAAKDLGINASVLSRAHRDHTSYQLLDDLGRLRTVDFQKPGPVEPPLPPPPPRPRRPGEKLLASPATRRTGVYR